MANLNDTLGVENPRRRFGQAAALNQTAPLDEFADYEEQEAPEVNMQVNPFRFTQHEINPMTSASSSMTHRTARARSPMVQRMEQAKGPTLGKSGLPIKTIGQIPEGLTGTYGMTPQQAVDFWNEQQKDMSEKEIKGLGDMMDLNVYDTDLIGQALGLSEDEIAAALADEDFQGTTMPGGIDDPRFAAYDQARKGLNDEQKLLRGLGSTMADDRLGLNLKGNWDMFNLMKMSGAPTLGGHDLTNANRQAAANLEKTRFEEQQERNYNEVNAAGILRGDVPSYADSQAQNYDGPGGLLGDNVRGQSSQNILANMQQDRWKNMQQSMTADKTLHASLRTQKKQLKKSDNDSGLLGKIMKGIALAAVAVGGAIMTAGMGTAAGTALGGGIAGGVGGAAAGGVVGGIGGVLSAGITGGDPLAGAMMGAAGGVIGGGIAGAGAASTISGGAKSAGVMAARAGTTGQQGLVSAMGGTTGMINQAADIGLKTYGQFGGPNLQPGDMVPNQFGASQMAQTFSPAMRAAGIRPGIFGTNPYYTPEVDLEANQAGAVG